MFGIRLVQGVLGLCLAFHFVSSLICERCSSYIVNGYPNVIKDENDEVQPSCKEPKHVDCSEVPGEKDSCGYFYAMIKWKNGGSTYYESYTTKGCFSANSTCDDVIEVTRSELEKMRATVTSINCKVHAFCKDDYCNNSTNPHLANALLLLLLQTIS